MASTVFGQSFCSLIFDLTGWMGMQKRKLNKAKALSLAVSGVGIVVMASGGEGTFALFYILLGVLAGALTMTQMVLNSTFASYKGPIRASHQNFIGGLAAGLLFYFLVQPQATPKGLATTTSLPFLRRYFGCLCSGEHQLCHHKDSCCLLGSAAFIGPNSHEPCHRYHLL